MEVDEVRQRDDLRIVDVREQDEWDAGHIAGAVHIPMGEITSRTDEFATAQPRVAVCRSGARSGQVAAFLRRQGVDIENLEGGMQAWDRAGYPMVSGNGGTPRVV